MGGVARHGSRPHASTDAYARTGSPAIRVLAISCSTAVDTIEPPRRAGLRAFERAEHPGRRRCHVDVRLHGRVVDLNEADREGYGAVGRSGSGNARVEAYGLTGGMGAEGHMGFSPVGLHASHFSRVVENHGQDIIIKRRNKPVDERGKRCLDGDS